MQSMPPGCGVVLRKYSCKLFDQFWYRFSPTSKTRNTKKGSLSSKKSLWRKPKMWWCREIVRWTNSTKKNSPLKTRVALPQPTTLGLARQLIHQITAWLKVNPCSCESLGSEYISDVLVWKPGEKGRKRQIFSYKLRTRPFSTHYILRTPTDQPVMIS